MKGKVTIFTSGKLISVGTRSETDASEELRQTERFLVRKGFIKSVHVNVTVRNIVAKVDFEMPINLEELASKFTLIYEPEQFPAGILRISEPARATLLLFASGRAIIAGLKSSDQIEPLTNRLMNIILQNQE
jgi:TATA-box binding protein (TBP) (component of TFIID and TFIIIB)